ncbi:protein translocase subunit SECA2, chloroplastic isoform X1 [Selaginella moellendorffii]|nr:protein translocase subunit SECA2, chloroplastic isoform X1 [Selaginella moellendorffii]|eukprot:XP_002977981.2 protein translocase subunit SECA2, chloroplastic isoform X1 [Selaginella moellendorffii]
MMINAERCCAIRNLPDRRSSQLPAPRPRAQVFFPRVCCVNAGALVIEEQSKNAEKFTSSAARIQEKVGRFLQEKLSLNHWIVGDYYNLVADVNKLEPEMKALSDKQLRAKTDYFRRRLAAGESLNDIQSEAFAVVREAGRRQLNMRHFDVQIVGGAVLHDGSIAEMKTGEGKTLVSTLAAYLNALTGEGVHVITVNDYLAQRDAEWMGQIYKFLGLSVGLVKSSLEPEERKAAYACDITYGNNSEFIFDYLRDHTCSTKEEMVMRWPRPLHFAVVDEIDSVLIDEGRNPFLLSSESSKNASRYPVAAEVADFLIVDRHYTVQQKQKTVELTEEGVAMAELALGIENLWDGKDPWARFVVTALKAKECYFRDVDYIVRDGKVQIVDEFTGRVATNRRWSDGIHQAVEAKEGVKINPETVMSAHMTYQSYFKLYSKVSGMTGTAKTEEKEFLKLFNMPVVEVPTNLPNIRVDLPLHIFPTARGKWRRVREEIEIMHAQGRPVLVGTTSVEESELLSALLHEHNIPHNVLNARAKYAAREAEIVAQAGRKSAITIATNMAGRGTDIILGGNPEMLAKEILQRRILPFMASDSPDVETDGAPLSQKGLSTIKLSGVSFSRIFRACAAAKVVCGSGGEVFSYREAKDKLLYVFNNARFEDEDRLIDLASGSGAETLSLGPSIALACLSVLRDCRAYCLLEGNEVKRLGGLHVIGTALHESRRIDNQLRGRAGRQGDPGSTRFMISFEDDMLQKYGGELAYKLMKAVGVEDVDVGSGITRHQVLSIQTSVEKYFSGVRRHMVEYDAVLEVHRSHVFKLREAFVMGTFDSCQQLFYQYIQGVADEMVLNHVDPTKPPRNWNLEGFLDEFDDFASVTFAFPRGSHLLSNVTKETIVSALSTSRLMKELPGLPPTGLDAGDSPMKAASLSRWKRDDFLPSGRHCQELDSFRRYVGDILIAEYQRKLESIQEFREDANQVERSVAISALDYFWRMHLANMSRLSSAVQITGFGHMNPLDEYKLDGARFFIKMLSAARRMTVESLLKPWAD